jgi:hypothetical protein
MSNAEESDKNNVRPKTRIYLTPEKCVIETCISLLSPDSSKVFKPSEHIRQMRVRTPWGIEVRPMRYMALEMQAGAPEELRYIDIITGTVYHPKTKHCSTAQLTLIGEKR